jgi:hypothetical protein
MDLSILYTSPRNTCCLMNERPLQYPCTRPALWRYKGDRHLFREDRLILWSEMARKSRPAQRKRCQSPASSIVAKARWEPGGVFDPHRAEMGQ